MFSRVENLVRINYSFEELKNKLQELDEWELVSFVPEAHHSVKFTTTKGVEVTYYDISGEIAGILTYKMPEGSKTVIAKIPFKFVLKNIHPRNAHRDLYIDYESDGISEEERTALWNSEFWDVLVSKLSARYEYGYAD